MSEEVFGPIFLAVQNVTNVQSDMFVIQETKSTVPFAAPQCRWHFSKCVSTDCQPLHRQIHYGSEWLKLCLEMEKRNAE